MELCAQARCVMVCCAEVLCTEIKCVMQGDREKEAGLTVSPLMDRSMKGGMTRSQVTPPTALPLPCIALHCALHNLKAVQKLASFAICCTDLSCTALLTNWPISVWPTWLCDDISWAMRTAVHVMWAMLQPDQCLRGRGHVWWLGGGGACCDLLWLRAQHRSSCLIRLAKICKISHPLSLSLSCVPSSPFVGKL